MYNLNAMYTIVALHVAIKQLGESHQPFITPFQTTVSISLPPPFLFTFFFTSLAKLPAHL